MSVYEEIHAARAAAHAKHGANSIEGIDGTDPRWLSILVEEVGEVAHEQTYDATGDLRAELVQVAAVAAAWVDALDRVERPSSRARLVGLRRDLAMLVLLSEEADDARELLGRTGLVVVDVVHGWESSSSEEADRG